MQYPKPPNNIAKLFIDMMHVSSYCETRRNLQGIHIAQFENHWEITATTGYQLHQRKFEGKFLPNIDDSVIVENSRINRDFLRVIERQTIDTFGIKLTSKFLTINNLELALVQKEFPKFQSVIPAKDKKPLVSISFNFDLLADLVKSMGQKKGKRNITMHFMREHDLIIVENKWIDFEASELLLMPQINTETYQGRES